MKIAKRLLVIALSLLFVIGIIPFTACKKKNVLKVYNCYDYIDEDLLDEFEEYYFEKTGIEIEVEYSCFDTPEHAYNSLKIDGASYDLLCPSDYMIEKMAREGMLQKFELEEDGNYNTYVSPYIKKVFKELTLSNGETIADYAAGYMWGTLGLVYNSNVTQEDMQTWASLWDAKYNNKFTIKNSVRDTYFIGLAYQYKDELSSAKTLYQSDNDLNKYQTTIKEIFNRTDSTAIDAVKNKLIQLGNNCKALEVDEGKEDIIKGNIDVYFAWSGDAVYALDCADEKDVELKYCVPEEGSNVWFDGWVIPKESKKTEEAKEFIEFLSLPENAIRNMDEIGYVSVIAGDEVFDRIIENYSDEEGTEEVDLSYFFDKDFWSTGVSNSDYIVPFKAEDMYRQLYAQYPSKEVVDRCAVMKYFPDSANDAINDMWLYVKLNIS